VPFSGLDERLQAQEKGAPLGAGSSQVYHVTPTSASSGTSSRRRPGVSRRLPRGMPALSGAAAARRTRKNARGSARRFASIPCASLLSAAGGAPPRPLRPSFDRCTLHLTPGSPKTNARRVGDLFHSTGGLAQAGHCRVDACELRLPMSHPNSSQLTPRGKMRGAR
jgi:hypothetical protein